MLGLLLHLTTLFTARNKNKPKQDDVVKINCFKPITLNVQMKYSFENDGANSPDCFGIKMADGKIKWLKVAYDWSLPKDTIIEKSNGFFKLKKECKVMPNNCTLYVKSNANKMIFKNTDGETFKMTCNGKEINLDKNMGIALNTTDLPNIKLSMKDGKFFTDKMVFINAWEMLFVNKENDFKLEKSTFVSNTEEFFTKVVESSTQLFYVVSNHLETFLKDNSKDLKSTIMLTYGYEDTVKLLGNPDCDLCDVNTVKDSKTKKEKKVQSPYKKFYEEEQFIIFDKDFSIESVVDDINVSLWNTLPKWKYYYDSVKNDASIDDQKKTQLWQFELLFEKLGKQKSLDLLEKGFNEEKNNFLEKNYGGLIGPKDVNLDHVKEFINGIDLEEIGKKSVYERYVEIGKLHCFLRELNNYLEQLKSQGIDVQVVETVLKTKTSEVAVAFNDAWKPKVQADFNRKMKEYRDNVDAYKQSGSVLKRDYIMEAHDVFEKHLGFYEKHGIKKIDEFKKVKEDIEIYEDVMQINGKENIADNSKAIEKEIDDELKNKTGKGLDLILARYNSLMGTLEKCKKVNKHFDQQAYFRLVSKGKTFADYKTKVDKKAKDLQDKTDKEAKDLQEQADKAAQIAKDAQDQADKAAKDTTGTEETKGEDSAKGKMSTGWIVGIVFIVLGVVCVAVAVGWFVWKKNISKEVTAVREKKEEEI